MPTREQVLAEQYRWRVEYADGSVLREEDDCPDQPGCHTWRCVGDGVVRLSLVPDGPSVDVSGGDAVFFRRRTIEATVRVNRGRMGVRDAWRQAQRIISQRPEPSETWIGVVRDGVAEYLRVMPDGSVERRGER